MLNIDKKCLLLCYPKLNKKELSIEIKTNEERINSESDIQLHKIILKYKERIDNNQKAWDRTKMYTNIYEPLTINKQNKAITFYEPISRAYFKLWEILIDLKLIESTALT